MSHEKRTVETGRVETIDLGDKVRVSVNGMFHGRGFAFEMGSLTGIDDDVTLEKILFYEDTSARLRATYSGTETEYIATIELREILDIDGNPSRYDFVNVKHASDRASWADSKTRTLWPLNNDD